MTLRAVRAASFWLAAFGSVCCGGGAASLSQPDAGGMISCSSDLQCGSGGMSGSGGNSGSGLVCVAGVCLPRANSVANLAFEIAPPIDSTAAFTELPATDRSTKSLVLTADPSVSLSISFTSLATPPTKVPTNAGVILTAPPLIPGRSNLTFQTNLTLGATGATLLIPAGVQGRHGSVTLVPIAPSDQTSPPFSFDVEIPTDLTPLMLDLPASSYTISGTLVDSLMTGKGQFSARAFEVSADPTQPGDLISTKQLTAANTPNPTTVPGHFVMLLPALIGSQPITATPISVQLTPIGLEDPWFTFAPMTLTATGTDLETIELPVYSNVNDFQVTAHGTDPTTGLEEAVDGASVRAYTKFDGGDMRGSAMFLRDATTDASGTASFSLIPGDSRTPRLYSLSVVPPPGSVWRTVCMSDVPVSWNGMNGPPAMLPDVPLTPRPVVTGTVLTAANIAVGNVKVTATRAPAATTPCLPGPAATSVTTDARGMFSLALDPGSYQFDYDPPDGSAAPRLTEELDVSDSMMRAVHLPVPVVVDGQVLFAGTTLPNATIRMFDTGTTPPQLLVQTQSDGMGHFRAVVASPPVK